MSVSDVYYRSSMSTYASVEADEQILPVPLKGSQPYSEVRLPLLLLLLLLLLLPIPSASVHSA